MTREDVTPFIGRHVNVRTRSGKTEGSGCILRGIRNTGQNYSAQSLDLEFPEGSAYAGRKVSRTPALSTLEHIEEA